MTWALDFAEVCAIIFGCAHFFTGLGVFLRPKAMSLFVLSGEWKREEKVVENPNTGTYAARQMAIGAVCWAAAGFYERNTLIVAAICVVVRVLFDIIDKFKTGLDAWLRGPFAVVGCLHIAIIVLLFVVEPAP